MILLTEVIMTISFTMFGCAVNMLKM